MSKEKSKKEVLWSLCRDCRRRLGSHGYLITDSERAPVWRPCALCGTLELVKPAELYRPSVRYKKHSGAGERAKAERRAK